MEIERTFLTSCRCKTTHLAVSVKMAKLCNCHFVHWHPYVVSTTSAESFVPTTVPIPFWRNHSNVRSLNLQHILFSGFKIFNKKIFIYKSNSIPNTQGCLNREVNLMEYCQKNFNHITISLVQGGIYFTSPFPNSCKYQNSPPPPSQNHNLANNNNNNNNDLFRNYLSVPSSCTS